MGKNQEQHQKQNLLRSYITPSAMPRLKDEYHGATLHVPNPRSDRDALIAATALVHGLTVATRNVADFEQTGVSVVNPWG